MARSPGAGSQSEPWPADSFIAAEDAEKGMAEMSEIFRETGSELYMGAGGREHD